jgi:hypothetical protein
MRSSFAEKRRPASALAKFSGFALSQPLHPAEQLGKGMGTNIGVSEGSAIVLAERDLVRRVTHLKFQLHAQQQSIQDASSEDAGPGEKASSKSFRLTTTLSTLRKSAGANRDVTERDSDDESHTGIYTHKKKVRNITDLRPDEMARLELRFKGDREDRGLECAEFGRVIAEFTGMEGNMGTQLFCKIDANDDGSIIW